MHPYLAIIPEEHRHGFPQILQEDQPDRICQRLFQSQQARESPVRKHLGVFQAVAQEGQEDDAGNDAPEHRQGAKRGEDDHPIAVAGPSAAVLARRSMRAGSGQQHGSVYLNAAASAGLAALDPAEFDGMTGSVTVDGQFELSAGEVRWDVTASLSVSGTGDAGPVTVHATEHLQGDVAYTATTLAGFSRADVSISASGGGRSEHLAVTLNADYDLTYAAPETCSSRVTGGTLVVKRIWAEIPSSAGDDPMFTDASARFTWSGCGEVTIAVSW